MSDGKAPRPGWIRFSGMGIEFAGAVIGFTAVGYWVGSHYDSERTGVLIGAIVGIVGGGYNLIRESLVVSRKANRRGSEPSEKEPRE